MPIELNELETKRFGVVAARLRDANASVDAINAAAAAYGVQLLTSRIAVDQLRRVHAFEADGHRLMDTLVCYGRSLENLNEPLTALEGLSLRLSSPADAVEVGEVAALGFRGYFGHYHTDPRLSDVAADAAYVEWATSAIAYATTPALIAVIDERIAGFMTLRLNSAQEVEAVLSAIHPAFEGRGVYGQLFSHVMIEGRRLGAERITASTQVNNHTVQRALARRGLVLQSGYYTFHKWY